jgi:hypothetical protein
MSTETPQSTATQQQLIAARGLTRIKAMPQWRKLSYHAKEALRLKLEKTNGNLIAAIALLQPRESHENNAALAREILSHPDVQCMERELGLVFENAAKEQAS